METSRFALGAMTFGSKLEQADARQVLHEALDHGVNLIDTADSYGKSEEMLGSLLHPEKREKVFLATKVFRRFCRDKHVGRNSRVNIINSLHRSLKLLQTDYVDLYQLHHPDAETPIMETLGTLNDMIRQGKVRYVGVSNHFAWQMAFMLGEARQANLEPILSAQLNYNIIDRQIERETVPFCNRFNMAIMCYGPLAGGILTGKYHGPDDIPENSRAARNDQLRQDLQDPVVQDVVDQLRQISEETGLKMNQLAMLWLKAKPHATVMLLGGSKPEHFRDMYTIADRDLDEDVVARIDQLSSPRVFSAYRNQPVRPGFIVDPAHC
jgi:aryl-alcohol dehydrogenase-like predicted oxidoreductase